MDRAEMTQLLERLVGALYDGGPVPAAEGGHLFHAICEECRSAGDLVWTESRIHTLARELGYWPWTVSQIETAVRKCHLDRHDSPATQPQWLHQPPPTAVLEEAAD